MKFDWSQYIGASLQVTMHENYGLVAEPSTKDQPIYEVVFKFGKLEGAYDEGILLKNDREAGNEVKIFVPYSSIKCVEIVSK
ncbi:MAG: hypothetical protein LC102_00545 [Ignavibacteriales bacterium]|jgi:hypothetical protein|nr:MAG: hypothetical protein F9K26_03730 [Ignavibacteriaceae bacterium]MBW7872545.1 hypothetical protein [Ignavibacteria bacterium]MCZ2141902.1 hypothetical protein [Ignavibacteriales bacterium]OQY75844.1 MAG: hypothetical protein B6D45_05050 [Ignavibacteriales bacterium UTCHB3]MBV6445069.1 hypothetical protein [Ignavibacteriaceae bacterium]